MSLVRTSSAARLFLGLFITAPIFTYLINWVPSLSLRMTDDPAPGPIEGIRVSLSQKSYAPPTITIKLTNTNPDPVTFLSYGSPLDGLALQLGLMAITPEGASTPIEIPTLEVQRKWPPEFSSFLTFAPGESQQQDIVLRDTVISPESVGARATVRLSGKWQAVWPKAKEDISEESLQKAGLSADAYSGDFFSNELEILITSWKS